jgi:amino acid adenylation domain-containing protein
VPSDTTPHHTVLDLISEQARSRPGAAAVRHDGTVLSYGDLWERSAALAAELVSLDATHERLVGLSARRSADLIIGFVGILMSGSACLPLDPAWPIRRLRFMLADADARLVVGDAPALASLPLDGRAGIVIDAGRPAAPDLAAAPLARADRLCYVIYTSGSTGQPKGVMHDHGFLASVVRFQCADSGCRPGEVTAQFAPISFDVTFQEVFSTLASGGTLICVDDAVKAEPARLWRLLSEANIARLFLPFAALETLALFCGSDIPGGLREVISAGEQLKCTAAIRAMFARLPGCRLTNHYGPTETHVITCHHLDGDPRGWPELPPIGVGVRAARLLVLDEDARPVLPGEPGQLWVGGPPVSRGYWRRPDLTAERFVVREGTRWYATGDLVRTGGTEFEYLGRQDDQVKVRGTRVEPAEVELALLAHPAVHAAAVVPVGASASTKILVAFVVSSQDDGLDGLGGLERLRAHVAARLPDGMVPTRFERVARLPLTPTGKVDRGVLRSCLGSAGVLAHTTIAQA